VYGFLRLHCLLKGEFWVCDRGTFLFSGLGVAVPPSGKGRRLRQGRAGDSVDAELASSSPNDCFLLFSADN